MILTVRFIEEDGWLEFSRPSAVLHAKTPDEAYAALDAAEAALSEGHWIAGLVPYELAGLRLGIFGPPAKKPDFEADAYMISPLLRRVAEDEYTQSIECIKRWIYDGEVYQVNYTLPFDFIIHGDPFSLWFDLACASRGKFQAFFEEADGTRLCRVLSWSPELFLEFDGSRVTTKPMKGTSPPDDVTPLQSPKNRAEHIMIVDLLRNDLRRVCDEVEVRELCTVERYPTFATMTSTIQGNLRAATRLSDVFRAAFPCGSITGAPKRAAMECIARLERAPRGAYCGTLGFLSPQRKGWWNVAIRTSQFENGIERFDAGGGIVSDSDSRDEWDEVRMKCAFLREAAEPVEVLETISSDAPDEVVELHLLRAAGAMQRLDGRIDLAALRSAIAEKAGPELLLRIAVSLDGSFEIACEPMPAQGTVAVCLSRSTVNSLNPWLRLKTSWRPAHRIAWEEAQAHGYFDALLTNERGEITEGTRTNVFVQIDGTLYTPPIDSGVLPGILRGRMLAAGRTNERVLYPDDLRRAEALYIGNSARGLMRAYLQA